MQKKIIYVIKCIRNGRIINWVYSCLCWFTLTLAYKICKVVPNILPNSKYPPPPKKMLKTLKILQKWGFFSKFGHTGAPILKLTSNGTNLVVNLVLWLCRNFCKILRAYRSQRPQYFRPRPVGSDFCHRVLVLLRRPI